MKNEEENNFLKSIGNLALELLEHFVVFVSMFNTGFQADLL